MGAGYSVRIGDLEAHSPFGPFPRHLLHVEANGRRADASLACEVVTFRVNGVFHILSEAWPFVAVEGVTPYDMRLSTTSGEHTKGYHSPGVVGRELAEALCAYPHWPRHGGRRILNALRRGLRVAGASADDQALGRAIRAGVR